VASKASVFFNQHLGFGHHGRSPDAKQTASPFSMLLNEASRPSAPSAKPDPSRAQAAAPPRPDDEPNQAEPERRSADPICAPQAADPPEPAIEETQAPAEAEMLLVEKDAEQEPQAPDPQPKTDEPVSTIVDASSTPRPECPAAPPDLVPIPAVSLVLASAPAADGPPSDAVSAVDEAPSTPVTTPAESIDAPAPIAAPISAADPFVAPAPAAVPAAAPTSVVDPPVATPALVAGDEQPEAAPTAQPAAQPAHPATAALKTTPATSKSNDSERASAQVPDTPTPPTTAPAERPQTEAFAPQARSETRAQQPAGPDRPNIRDGGERSQKAVQVADIMQAARPSPELIHFAGLQSGHDFGQLVAAAVSENPGSNPNTNSAATFAAPVPVEGLAIEIAARAKAGGQRFEIRLDPPELGRIDVRLDIDRSGQVTSRLVVERAETLDVLRRDAHQLERALQDAGLKTSDSGLQFALRDQPFTQRDEGDRSGMLHEPLIDPDLPAADGVAAEYRRLAIARDGIDIRI
jgi:flagellar hook-length control protein FliK